MALENLQLRSLIKKSGELELSLVKLPVAVLMALERHCTLVEEDARQAWLALQARSEETLTKRRTEVSM